MGLAKFVALLMVFLLLISTFTGLLVYFIKWIHLKKTCFNVRKKNFFKTFYFQIIPIFILGLSVGIISIWPGITSGNSRKCFFNILLDGSDGSVRVGTLFSINSSYLLKIKNTENKYLKILFIGDSCFRKF